jgi:hypothetical protein
LFKTNGLMKVTASPGGRLTMRMLSGERNGRWSVDDLGRLRADITGREETADAWIAGNQLTITVKGEGLTFPKGKAAVSRNAYKGGFWLLIRQTARELRAQRKYLGHFENDSD